MIMILNELLCMSSFIINVYLHLNVLIINMHNLIQNKCVCTWLNYKQSLHFEIELAKFKTFFKSSYVSFLQQNNCSNPFDRACNLQKTKTVFHSFAFGRYLFVNIFFDTNHFYNWLHWPFMSVLCQFELLEPWLKLNIELMKKQYYILTSKSQNSLIEL